jgi:hypothetical protein
VSELSVGVVGYEGEYFDQDEVFIHFYTAFEAIEARHPGLAEVTLVVLVADNRGVPVFACYFAASYEYLVKGVTCTAAPAQYDAPVRQYVHIEGDMEDAFGAFLEMSDVLLRVGSSQRALEAVTYFRRGRREVYEYEIATSPPDSM